MSDPYNTWEIRTKTNLLVMVSQFYDEDYSPPWKDYDGHGIVSWRTCRDKRAGELILDKSRGQRLYYDLQETMKKARQEGWFCVVTATVIEDWMGNDVSEMDISESCWGIEDGYGEYGRNAESYIKEVADDLAREAEHEYLKQTGELWRLHFVETLEKIDAKEQSERGIA